MFFTLLAAPLARAAPMPTGLLGLWQVEHVRNDRGATHKLIFQEDDPRLVGRHLDVSAARISFQTADGDAVCAAPSISSVPQTAEALIGTTMAGRGAPPSIPGPQDYGLALKATAPVDALLLRCGSGLVGPGFDSQTDTWFLQLPGPVLAMGYFNSTILILSPVATAEAPRASFDCGKAGTPTEKAICASRELAGLDRSVALAFGGDRKQFTATGDQAAVAKLETSERDWLRLRDRCGADANCLRKVLAGRLQALADTVQFTGE